MSLKEPGPATPYRNFTAEPKKALGRGWEKPNCNELVRTLQFATLRRLARLFVAKPTFFLLTCEPKIRLCLSIFLHLLIHLWLQFSMRLHVI